jgi:P-type E1-E2 ATPase
MTAALFVVACADDVAVAIPLAMTASLGMAARRGVIVKGGEWFEALSKVDTLVLDKTGTLTYGRLSLLDVHLEPGVDEARFWRSVGSAEKLSEHPVGKAMFREAVRRLGELPDPTKFEVRMGSGVVARVDGAEVVVGNETLLADRGVAISPEIAAKVKAEREEHAQTTVLVAAGGAFAGLVTVADVPRAEAAEGIRKLRNRGVRRIVMLTGDTERIAAEVSKRLGIPEHRASMKPEDKLRALEEMAKTGTVAMIGDGINDAPALARAHVGIAMGGGGTAVAVEAADVVILTDDLTRVAEMIALGRRTMAIVRSDIGIWVVTNAVGFALVLTGVAGPALAAFYNFATDFLPLLNSSRLFRLDFARRPRRNGRK